MKILRLDRDPVDLDGVVALMTATFGPRGDERALLDRWRVEPHRAVRVAVEDGEVVGLAVLTVTDSADPSVYAEPFGADLSAITAGGPVAVFNQIAVAPTHRQRGVATALGLALIDWLADQPVAAALGVSWSHGGPHHSGHLFRAAGFAELGRCQGFYRRFQDATGQPCTECPPAAACTCTAILYGIRASALVAAAPRP